jgi:RNA polymerase sigma-70 factor (ECF subfamily)
VCLAAAITLIALAAGLPVYFTVPIVVLCLLAIVVLKVGTVARAAEPLPRANMTADAWIVVAIALVIGGGLLTFAISQQSKSAAPAPAAAVPNLSDGEQLPGGTPSELSAGLPRPGSQAVPPVVIETVPQSGDAAVDPALTEIRVVFSKPMQDGSWTWAKRGDGNFPVVSGQPKLLADGRTCVLPVRLQPGKVYPIWLNSEYQHDFKDREGRSAVPYLLIFETRR